MTDPSTRSIRKPAGWLALTVLATLLYGVLALWLTNQANHRQIEEFNRILRALDTTRLAQVHFKTQVQEWKNVLLRGQEASDYERYLGQFHAQAAATIEQLQRAGELKKELGLDASDVAAALTEHQSLMRSYEEGLQSYRQDMVASVFAADDAVRGKDRPLNERIDGIAEAMEAEADRRMAVFAGEDHSRYQRLRWIFIALSASTLLLAARVVMVALRRKDSPVSV